MSSFNAFAKKTTTYSGNTPVWADLNVEVMPIGGTLSDDYVIDNLKIPAGMPVYIDAIGGTVTPLELFELTSDLSTADASVYVMAGNLGTVPTTDLIFAVFPSSGSYATAKAAKASAVSAPDASGIYTLTITPNAIGAGSDGGYLCLCTSTGTGKALSAPANGILYNDICFEDGAEAATAAVALGGVLLVDRCPVIPALVQAALPNIHFIKES